MKEYENLLNLIATGHSVRILNEPDLILKFNELLQQELIEINEEKVVLTTKGKDALSLPVVPTVPSPITEQEIKEFGHKARIKGKTFYFLSLFLLMISILFVLAVNN